MPRLRPGTPYGVVSLPIVPEWDEHPFYRGAHGKSRLGRAEPLLCQCELSWQALSMNQESHGFSRAERQTEGAAHL